MFSFFHHLQRRQILLFGCFVHAQQYTATFCSSVTLLFQIVSGFSNILQWGVEFVNGCGEILSILVDDDHIWLPVCKLRILRPLSQFFLLCDDGSIWFSDLYEITINPESLSGDSSPSLDVTSSS